MHFLAAVAVPVASAVSTGGDHTGQAAEQRSDYGSAAEWMNGPHVRALLWFFGG